jgi:N-acetylmuramate 1-kinase
MTLIAPSRMEEIQDLLAPTEFNDAQLLPLAGDASFRRYVRVKSGARAAMLMDAPPDKEDVRPFVNVADYLKNSHYSAPTILASNIPAGLLLLEDLGDDSFSTVLKRQPDLAPELYASAIDVLVQWQDGARAFSDPQRLVLPCYNTELLMREVALFTDWFLPQAVGVQQAQALRDGYLEIWQELLLRATLSQNLFVHRDYHADNLMWLPQRDGTKRVGLLDFQDGVYGDGAYDLVSLLEDARRDVPTDLAGAMIERYISAARVDAEQFRLAYALLGAQRNSKIIGIFARLAVRDHKQHYLHFLPRVWGHLHADLRHPLLQPLKLWLDTHVPQGKRGVFDINASH